MKLLKTKSDLVYVREQKDNASSHMYVLCKYFT